MAIEYHLRYAPESFGNLALSLVAVMNLTPDTAQIL